MRVFFVMVITLLFFGCLGSDENISGSDKITTTTNLVNPGNQNDQKTTTTSGGEETITLISINFDDTTTTTVNLPPSSVPPVTIPRQPSDKGEIEIQVESNVIQVNGEHDNCSSDADCTFVFTRCDRCQCYGEPVNQDYYQIYHEKFLSTCESYQGTTCELQCPRSIMKCVRGDCMVFTYASLEDAFKYETASLEKIGIDSCKDAAEDSFLAKSIYESHKSGRVVKPETPLPTKAETLKFLEQKIKFNTQILENITTYCGTRKSFF